MKRHWTSRNRTAVLIIAFIAALIVSWLPGGIRPTTIIFSGNIEHFLAYAVLGAMAGLFAPRHLSCSVLVLLLVLFAALMEIGQVFLPSRNASWENFLAGSAGAACAIYAIIRVRRRMAPKSSDEDTQPHAM